MIVQNLIYNRLGNSISIMLDTGTEIVQLHDEVVFGIGKKKTNVYGLSNLDEGFLKIGLKVEGRDLLVRLYTDDSLKLKVEIDSGEIVNLKYSDSSFQFFVSKDDFNLVFKLMKTNFQFLTVKKVEDGYVVSLGENFLKSLIELLLLIEKI